MDYVDRISAATLFRAPSRVNETELSTDEVYTSTRTGRIQYAPACKTDSHRRKGLTRIRDGWTPADLQHLSALSTPARLHWTTGHTSLAAHILPPYSLTPLIQEPRSFGQPTTFSTLRERSSGPHGYKKSDRPPRAPDSQQDRKLVQANQCPSAEASQEYDRHVIGSPKGWTTTPD